MSGDEAKQNALADVWVAAQRLHEVRALEQELGNPVAVTAREAVSQGVPAHLVAKGAGVTPGRVSQIIAQRDRVDVLDWRDRIRQIGEYPGDALRRYAEGFAGVMTFPPYGRDRTATAPTPQEPPRRHYTDGFPYEAPASLDELHGPTSGKVTVPVHIDPFPDALFDVDVWSSRRSLYGAVVRAGEVEDQRRFLDAQLLRELWTDLALPAPSRALWESRIPELAGS